MELSVVLKCSNLWNGGIIESLNLHRWLWCNRCNRHFDQKWFSLRQGHCELLVWLRNRGGVCCFIPNPCHYEYKDRDCKRDVSYQENRIWSKNRLGVVSKLIMINLASAVTSGWLKIAIPLIMAITRVASWVGAMVIMSVAGTFTISGQLVLRAISGWPCRLQYSGWL